MDDRSLAKYFRLLSLLLPLAAGIYILWPFHDFQLHLAQGDHGRDLYCFSQILDGKIPYRDFIWAYGPLMLYYYALCFKLLGVNIHSVLLGYNFLFLLSGLTVYGIVRLYAPAYLAATAAVWFWVFDTPFEYTYNHVGGTLLILAVLYALLRYHQTREKWLLWGGLAGIFLLFLLKINFGVSTLTAFLGSLWLLSRDEQPSWTAMRKPLFIAGLIAVPLAAAGIYLWLVNGMPAYAIKQCFPYGSEYLQDHPARFDFIKIFFEDGITVIRRHWGNTFFFALTLASGGWIIFLLWRKKLAEAVKRDLFFALGTLLIFSLCTLHEFVINPILHRTYWNKPVQMVLLFLVLAFAVQKLPRRFKILIAVVLLAAAVQRHTLHRQFVNNLKIPLQKISLPRGQVYVANSFPWLGVVHNVCLYLQDNLKPDETFLALVDDPLYYFLTGKDSPVPLLSFSEHVHIPPEQEISIIRALQEKRVNHVLISNRANSKEPGMGIFGKTYCPRLAKYIAEHFASVGIFGEWKENPGWFADHAVEILKRKQRPVLP